MRSQFLSAIAFFGSALVVHALTFSSSQPTQCDPLNITWTGGQGPFQLELIPVFGTQRHYPIPNSSFVNGKGLFQTQLAFPEGQKFLMLMSDASGFASGGVSNVLTVGESVGKQNCNTTDPGVAFSFELNSALQQCAYYTFSGYNGAIQPVTIQAMVPGGQSFTLNPPTGSNSYDWLTDVAAGTSLLFTMSDSRGREGGSSDVLPVATSNDNSCLVSSSLSSTANPPSPTGSTTSSGAAAATTTVSTGTTISGGAIAGTVIGGLIALATIVTLALFFLRRKMNNAPYSGPSRRHSNRLRSVDLAYDPALGGGHARSGSNVYAYPVPNTSSGSLNTPMDPPPQFLHPSQLEPNPFILPPTPATTLHSHHFNEEPETPGFSSGAPSNRTSMSSAARRKAAMAGVSPTAYRSRFILHTDAEELPPHAEEEVVELPPQYTDRRQPYDGLSSIGTPTPSQHSQLYEPSVPGGFNPS